MTTYQWLSLILYFSGFGFVLALGGEDYFETKRMQKYKNHMAFSVALFWPLAFQVAVIVTIYEIIKKRLPNNRKETREPK